MRTTEEQRLIDAYIAAGGRVYKARTGESGIYDQFGVALLSRRDRNYRKTRERLEKIQRMTAAGVNRKEQAHRLGMSYNALTQLVRRWGGGWTDDDFKGKPGGGNGK